MSLNICCSIDDYMYYIYSTCTDGVVEGYWKVLTSSGFEDFCIDDSGNAFHIKVMWSMEKFLEVSSQVAQ